MKASEILHGLAELLAGLEQGREQDPTQSSSNPISKYTPDAQEPDGVDTQNVFVPPLQAKIELLKKAVDVDNIYSDQDAGSEDELARMRTMAGINPVVADEAASDEPLDI
jgi:hypothetical protein